MRRWVAGEEDWHDRIVTEYKKRISNEYAAAKAEQEMRKQALDQLRQSREGMSVTTLVGYTPDQLQTVLRERDLGEAPGVRWVADGQQSPRDYLYEKYLERSPDAGKLGVMEGKVVETVPQDLTELVEGRQVPFYAGPDDQG